MTICVFAIGSIYPATGLIGTIVPEVAVVGQQNNDDQGSRPTP